MNRWRVLTFLMILVVVFVGLTPESVAQQKPCLILYDGFFNLDPADAVVFRGDQFVFSAEVDARQGSWDVVYDVQADVRGFDKQGRIRWNLPEGTVRVIETPVLVLDDIEPGIYDMRVVVTGIGTNCSGPATRIAAYSFNLEVRDFANSFIIDDGRSDAFNQLTGDAAALPAGDGLDIVQLSGQRLNDRLRVTFDMDGRVPNFVEDAPRRIGCYIDTNGDATVDAPFVPTGFEYLMVNSWRSEDPFLRLIRLSDESTNPDVISTSLGLQSVTTEILLVGLGNPTKVDLLCFSEFNNAVDLAPNTGFLGL